MAGIARSRPRRAASSHRRDGTGSRASSDLPASGSRARSRRPPIRACVDAYSWVSSPLYRAFLRFRRVLPTVIFMTTKTAEPIDLPAPVAAYFAADTTGAEAVAQCFTDGAVVIDERQEYRGRTAIARWKV